MGEYVSYYFVDFYNFEKFILYSDYNKYIDNNKNVKKYDGLSGVLKHYYPCKK